MRHIKEILRLKAISGLSNRQIANACNISPTTVSKYLEAAAKSDAAYDDIKVMSDEQLTVLFEDSEGSNIRKSPKQMPEMNYIHSELKRRGVTLQLLWEEYRMDHPDGYSRTQFCYYYNRWKKKLNPTMRMNHTAGKKVFVDFSGDKPLITDPLTGSKREVELFVGVSGASSYTFAIAVDNQNIENWINCHIKMFNFFKGVPEAIVPDNLKSGIKDACYYEPEINPTYADMAAHYNVAILPARVRKPKDKAKVENGVLNVQRRILASLRNKTFFSLNDLNRAIAKELEKLNNRPMQHIGISRSDLFSQSDKPAFGSLPDFPFELFRWKKANVGIDYHIEVDKSYYSVPYILIGKTVDIRYTGRIVEIFCGSKKVSSHPRQHIKGKYLTLSSHMPASHRYYAEQTPKSIRDWAQKIGRKTLEFCNQLIQKRHPEQAFRSCMGIMNLTTGYPAERVEKACGMALSLKACYYRNVKNILSNNQDRLFEERKPEYVSVNHNNIRGKDYYRNMESDHAAAHR